MNQRTTLDDVMDYIQNDAEEISGYALDLASLDDTARIEQVRRFIDLIAKHLNSIRELLHDCHE